MKDHEVAAGSEAGRKGVAIEAIGLSMECDGPTPRQVLVSNAHDVEWRMLAGRWRSRQV
jgi:hypothetical protein